MSLTRRSFMNPEIESSIILLQINQVTQIDDKTSLLADCHNHEDFFFKARLNVKNHANEQ